MRLLVFDEEPRPGQPPARPVFDPVRENGDSPRGRVPLEGVLAQEDWLEEGAVGGL